MRQKNYTWPALILIVSIISYFFLRPFLTAICLGLLSAFLFTPLFNYLRKRLSNRSSKLAVPMTVFFSQILVAAPLLIIIILVAWQALTAVDSLSNSGLDISGTGLQGFVDSSVETINSRLESWFGVTNTLDSKSLLNSLTDVLSSLLSSLGNSLVSTVSGIPHLITSYILYLFVFYASLGSSSQLMKTIRGTLPFNKRIADRYLSRMGAMAKAMVKGQLLIAVMQGVVGALSLALIGLGDYVLLFAVLLSVLSFIPLGGGLLTIPLGIVALLTGNVGGGIAVILVHFLVVTNIDNVIRPKVVSNEAYLPPVFVILGAFAGVAAFGFLGVIYGPILMIFITTTIESYLENKQRLSSKKP